MAPVTTLTGTSVPQDANAYLSTLLQTLLGQRSQDVTMRGQDIEALLQQQGNSLTQRGQDTQLALGNLQAQSQYQNLWADYYAKGQQAQAQYRIDVANLGLEQARLNYEQRLADANLVLQTQGQKLQDVMQGYSQRQGAAQMKFDAVKALADRSGPQDMFKYASLLGGLGTPMPGPGYQVDPTKFADNLVDFRYRDPNKDSGIVGAAPTVNQPYSGVDSLPTSMAWRDLPFSAPSAQALPSATGSGMLQLPPQVAQLGGGAMQPPSSPASFWSGGGLKTTGNPPGWGGQVTNNQMSPNQGTDTNTIGLPLSAISGLKSGQSGLYTTGYGGDTRGSDWDPSVQVSDPATGHVYGPSDVVPKGMSVWINRLAGGTGGQGNILQMLLQMLQQRQAAQGAGQAPPGMMNDPVSLVGDAPTNQAPDAGGAKPEMLLNPTGAPLAVANHNDTQQLLQALMQMHGAGEEGGEPMQSMGEEQADVLDKSGKVVGKAPQKPKGKPAASKSKPKRHAGGTLSAAERRALPDKVFAGPGRSFPIPDKGHAKAALGRINNAPPSARPEIRAAALQMLRKAAGTMERYASGTGTYGMPDLPEYQNYSPEQYGNLPFIKGLRQDNSGIQWQGFAQPLSNQTYGLNDMPTTLNLRNFYNAPDSIQKATKSAYEDALATNFADIVGRSQKAAPIGATFGATHYGIR